MPERIVTNAGFVS